MKTKHILTSVLFSLLLFALLGCESVSAPLNESYTSDTTAGAHIEDLTDVIVSTTPETIPESAPETDRNETATSPEENRPDNNSTPGSDSLMATGYFESLCEADRLHNLITATYTGYTFDRNGCFELSFRVHKLHLGLEVGDTVHAVYYPANDVNSQNPDDIIFTEGESYLVFLTRYRNVYENGDTYQVVGRNMLIPANDFQAATLYNTPLAEHVAGMKRTASTTLEQFISYIQSITTENQPFSGQDYIQSNARADVMTASPHVVTVTTASVTSSMSTLTVTLRCRVDSVQKGSLTVGEYIDIMFPLDANVGLNETFILTLNDPLPSGMNWYTFSCKQAMYPISETADIMAIIQGDHVAE